MDKLTEIEFLELSLLLLWLLAYQVLDLEKEWKLSDFVYFGDCVRFVVVTY